MRITGAAAVLTTLVLASSASAQTYSNCNPLEETCPADPALGKTSDVTFTSGSSSQYTGSGDGISYTSSGAELTVSKSGDNPTLTSSWYIMFGRVDFVFKAAPGVGMVSSAILISDDLDEIDWELLGADSSQAQTNYFSKGVTGSYDRGGDSSVSNSQSDFNTYTIDWNADQINWEINGVIVRTLSYAESDGQYPQSPMQVKVGSWAGGDSTNAEGTIEWAGGPINYADGPFTMYVQSVNVQDYSTGSEYKYEGTSGSWQDITAVGGSVGSTGSSSGSTGSTSTPTSGSAATSTWSGTHEETSSFTTPSVYPWVPSSTAEATASSAAPPASSYLATLGVESTSSAPTTTYKPASSSPSPSLSSAAASVAAAGCETVTTYDNQGFLTTAVIPTGAKHYDNQGFLISSACGGSTEPTAAVRANWVADATTLARITAKPFSPQVYQNIASPTSSQSPNDRTFYQTTETTQGAGSANSAGRTGASIALLGFFSAALILVL